MARKKRTLWMVAVALCLSAFSFAAGFGIRGLTTLVTSGKFSLGVARGLAAAGYPRVASAAPGAGEPDLRPAELYKDVYNKLHVYYVEPLPSDTRLAEGSVESMLASLDDPNTRLISAREWSAIQDLGQGSLHGLGAVLTIRKYKEAEGRELPGIALVAALPGSAAEKAGLQPGDRITFVDGHWVAPVKLSFREQAQIEDNLGPQDFARPPHPDESRDSSDPEREKRRREDEEARRRWLGAMDVVAAMELLETGKPGEHELTIQRAGSDKKTKVTFADARADLFSARKLNPSTGYLRIVAIRPETAREVEQALSGFKRDGVQSLVIDLRESPGGSLETVREIVGALAPGAPVLISRERDANRKLVDRKIASRTGAQRLKATAISVLVDGGTAGSSEVLAAALRDDLGARVVGAQTFGDGTEQQVIPLGNGAAISITHARMLSPKGTDYEGKGLKPDFPGGPGDAGIEAGVRALTAPGRPAAATHAAGRR
jgi:carboxyl-terminal processing protease